MTARRRFGSIRQQSNSRWQARYKGPDGQPRQGETTFVRKTDAQRYLARIEADMDRGVWSDRGGGAPTLAEYAGPWLEHRRLAPRTRELYGDLLRGHLLPQLGQMRLARIAPEEVRRWHSGRLAATGPVRTSQAYRLLRVILNTAKGDGLLVSNPCQIRGAGSVASPERPYVSREQVEALADAMPYGLRPLVIVTFWAHLRLGELLALRRDDVDLVTGTLHIHRQIVRLRDGPVETTTKTGKGRVVHLPTQAVAELQVHFAATGPAMPSARLFTHRSGGALERQHVERAWKKAREEVGLPTVHFHDLRHAGLTLVAQKGATTREIMARGGHTTARAAMIYQHAAEERDAAIAMKLSDEGDRSEPHLLT